MSTNPPSTPLHDIAIAIDALRNPRRTPPHIVFNLDTVNRSLAELGLELFTEADFAEPFEGVTAIVLRDR